MLFRVKALETGAIAPAGQAGPINFRWQEAGTVRRVWFGTSDGVVASRAGLGLQVFRLDDRRQVVNDGELPAFSLGLAEIGSDPLAGNWAELNVHVNDLETWALTLDNEGAGGVTPRLVFDFQPDHEGHA